MARNVQDLDEYAKLDDDDYILTAKKLKLGRLTFSNAKRLFKSLVNLVTKTESGLMSPEDKTKLDGIDTDSLAKKSDIPVSLSQLSNDTGFITKVVSDLENYYNKTNSYSKAEINDLIADLSSIKIKVVETLPTKDIATNTIYFVPATKTETDNIYDEYIYVSNKWERIGNTKVDLSDYYTKSEVDAELAKKQNTITFPISIANGGTGKTTAKAAQNALLSGMNEATSDITDDTFITHTYITPSDSNGALYKRKASGLWNYIKSKFGVSSNFTADEKKNIRTAIGAGTSSFSGNYSDLTDKPTIDTAMSSSSTNAVQNKVINTALDNKVDKVSGKSLSTNDFTTTLKNKLDGIASGATNVTETTVSGWGFTKNTGTYSKPSTGIPKTDLASAVQTSLGKADTALQSHQDISGKVNKYNASMVGLGFTANSKVDVATFLETIRTKYGSNCIVTFGWSDANGAFITDGTNETELISGYTLFVGLNAINKSSGTWQPSGAILVGTSSRKNMYVLTATISDKAGTVSSKSVIRMAKYSDLTTTISKIEYQSGSSATSAPTGTWSTTPTTTTKGQYLWTRITFSDNKVSYAVAYNGKDGAVTSVAGKTGAVTLAKGDVGLGNVDNTSDANKPVSTATQTALDGKVDKVSGKGLSTNDFTDVDKASITYYGTCSTSRATNAKVVACANFELATGRKIVVKFTDTAGSAPTSGNITLNVNSKGAKNVYNKDGTQMTYSHSGEFRNNRTCEFVYDGTNFVWLNYNSNTTYSTITQAEITAGTSTSTRVVTPKLLVDNFVKKESGKGLSTNDFTTTLKNKLDGIASGATNVTETTVSGWGFTKNTGTYSKPSTGIPKTDLASAVQTSLDRAINTFARRVYGSPSGTTRYIKIDFNDTYAGILCTTGYNNNIWFESVKGKPFILGESLDYGIKGYAWSSDGKTLYLQVSNYRPICISIPSINNGSEAVTFNDWTTTAPEGVTFLTTFNRVAKYSELTTTISKIEYQSGSSATTAPTGTWSTTVPSVAQGNYLWTRITFSDNKVSYSVARQGKDGAVTSVAGKTGAVTLAKGDVGLGSVANTGDSATPVSGGTTKFTTGGAYTELAKKVNNGSKTDVASSLTLKANFFSAVSTQRSESALTKTAKKIVSYEGGGTHTTWLITIKSSTYNWFYGKPGYVELEGLSDLTGDCFISATLTNTSANTTDGGGFEYLASIKSATSFRIKFYNRDTSTSWITPILLIKVETWT